jgi:Ser/Thr protein kinase RdoA (MazF antagonist)
VAKRLPANAVITREVANLGAVGELLATGSSGGFTWIISHQTPGAPFERTAAFIRVDPSAEADEVLRAQKRTQCIALVQQVQASVLAEVFRKAAATGLVHNDLNTGNILFEEAGGNLQPNLIDWDIALPYARANDASQRSNARVAINAAFSVNNLCPE